MVEGPAAPYAHEVVEAAAPMAVDLEVVDDPIAGWNVRIVPTGSAFAPEQASGQHVDGVGHAHLFVDGEKVGRLYGGWAHLGMPMSAGEHVIEVVLSTNHHADYAVDGVRVADQVAVVVPQDRAAEPASMASPAEEADAHDH